ncbi:adenosine deaminase [Paracoccaceae bacterium GXU_MW_L88]
MKKIELHCHLEGAAPPDFIRQKAAAKKRELGDIFDEKGNYRWVDFADFLETYGKASAMLETPEDFRDLVEEVLRHSAEHGVIYQELFIAPDIYADGDPGAFPDYLAAMREGAEAAKAAHGIETRLISTIIRNFGAERARKTAALSARYADDFMTGFGMGGEERMYEMKDFAMAFDEAREAGLGITVHAGEWRGAPEVAAALDHIRPARIGHGVRAIEEDDLVKRIADEGVVLEVNPVSNIVLGVFPTMAQHPIQKLREAGVKVTVSTDDPPYFDTTMSREYRELGETFGWEEEDFREINLNAIDAAFCDEATKARLRKEFSS